MKLNNVCHPPRHWRQPTAAAHRRGHPTERRANLGLVATLRWAFLLVPAASALAVSSLPLVNSGFESGALGGRPTGWTSGGDSLPRGPMVVYQSPYNSGNQYAVMLPGTTLSYGANFGSVSQTVTMPTDTDVRWSFWVRASGATWTGNSLDFTATLTDGMTTRTYGIYDDLSTSLPSGWSQTPVMGGYEIQSENLAGLFAAGDSLTVSFTSR